jgi:hypothetical protein
LERELVCSKMRGCDVCEIEMLTNVGPRTMKAQEVIVREEVLLGLLSKDNVGAKDGGFEFVSEGMDVMSLRTIMTLDALSREQKRKYRVFELQRKFHDHAPRRD